MFALPRPFSERKLLQPDTGGRHNFFACMSDRIVPSVLCDFKTSFLQDKWFMLVVHVCMRVSYHACTHVRTSTNHFPYPMYPVCATHTHRERQRYQGADGHWEGVDRQLQCAVSAVPAVPDWPARNGKVCAGPACKRRSPFFWSRRSISLSSDHASVKITWMEDHLRSSFDLFKRKISVEATLRFLAEIAIRRRHHLFQKRSSWTHPECFLSPIHVHFKPL